MIIQERCGTSACIAFIVLYYNHGRSTVGVAISVREVAGVNKWTVPVKISQIFQADVSR